MQIAHKKEAIKGFSVAIVNENGFVYSNGLGFTDIAETKPYTANTIQNIASISKSLIGVALLKEQELGKINLNDPINQYLPFDIVNPYFPEVPILVKHLAYHNSSINDLDEVYVKSYVMTKDKHDDNEGVYDYFNKPKSKISLQQYIQNSLTPNGKWYSKHSFLNV